MTLDTITSDLGAGLAAPLANSEKLYETYKAALDDSKTAQSIFQELENSDLCVGILFINSGYDSMHIPGSNTAKAKELARFTGGIAVVNIESEMSITGGDKLPIFVSMMHELGHAMQNVTNTEWYYEQYATYMAGGDDKRTAQLAIENDNIQTYEKPICQELRLPHRDEYD